MKTTEKFPSAPARLGVNIDHLATLRQLRGTPYPSLLHAVDAVARGGGTQITVHLREDRRHIQDADVREIAKHIRLNHANRLSLNLEMAISDEIVRFAKRLKPDWVCLVPEKRQEVTTEGGLDLKKQKAKLARLIPEFRRLGIKVSLFVEPDVSAIKLSQAIGADAVELHTGRFAEAVQKNRPAAVKRECGRIKTASLAAKQCGLHLHAGHGLDAKNVRLLAFDFDIEEFNIGHFLVCRATEVGLERSVREMVAAIQAP